MLGAAYMLYLYQRTMFGKIENPKNERLLDLSHREFATFAPLLVLAVWMGLYPAPFLRRLDIVGAAHRRAREPAVRDGERAPTATRRRRRRADRGVEQPGGEVPGRDAVRRRRQPARPAPAPRPDRRARRAR